MAEIPQGPAPGYPDQATPSTSTFQGLITTLLNGVQVLSRLVTGTNNIVTATNNLVSATQALAPSASPTFLSIKLNSGAAGETALQHYMEGTWTPVLLFGGANTGMTFGTQTGSFTRIGRMVFCSFQIVLTAKGASTGSATISGLPFAAAAASFGGGAIPTYSNMATLTETPAIAVNSGASTVNLLTFGAAASAALADTAFSATSNIQGYFRYHV